MYRIRTCKSPLHPAGERGEVVEGTTHYGIGYRYPRARGGRNCPTPSMVPLKTESRIPTDTRLSVICSGSLDKARPPRTLPLGVSRGFDSLYGRLSC